MDNFQQIERKNDEATTYDLSITQNVSSSTCPPRNIYHERRKLTFAARCWVMPVIYRGSGMNGGKIRLT